MNNAIHFKNNNHQGALQQQTNLTNASEELTAQWSQFCGWQFSGGNVHLYMNVKRIDGELNPSVKVTVL